jgi:hypothetical protein
MLPFRFDQEISPRRKAFGMVGSLDTFLSGPTLDFSEDDGRVLGRMVCQWTFGNAPDGSSGILSANPLETLQLCSQELLTAKYAKGAKN